MKISHIITFIALMLSLTVQAQQPEINKANELFKKGEYLAAAEAYENVYKNYGSSPELFYNTGNAYFKAGETAKAILCYERALRLNPSYDDARNNLEFAQTKIVDNIVQIPPFFIKKWINSLIRLLSPDQWYIVSILMLLITIGGFLYFVFGNSLQIRKISFYLTFVFLAFTVTTVIFATARLNKLTQHNQAIIMTGSVTVKSSPDESGTDLFQLHEGTKVEIKTTLDSWIEIEVGNGNIGWIEKMKAEKI